MLVQACINGGRSTAEHSRTPITAEQIAADAVACAAAGAGALHVHPRDAWGNQSLRAADVASVCTAVRSAVPQLPISVTTAAWIERSPEVRLRLIDEWRVLPDLASVNLAEDGALGLITLLNEMGVGVEAGVWTPDDARLLVDEGLDSACSRILVEIQDVAGADAALRRAAEIDSILDDGQVQAPRLHHGEDQATWAVIQRAMDNGHDVRIGLEDTLVDARGVIVSGNASLVTMVIERARQAGRAVDSGALSQRLL